MVTVLITTSREPSQRTRSLVNELVAIIPVLSKFNRGKSTLKELYDIALSRRARFLVMVYEKKGNPSMLRIYSVDTVSGDLVPRYNIFLKGLTLYRDRFKVKPTPYKGSYCVEGRGDGAAKLAGVLSVVLNYPSCLNPIVDAPRRIIVDLHGNVFTIKFIEMNRLVGPILRVRRYEVQE